MPSIETLRKWLKGEDVDGYPPRSLSWDKAMAVSSAIKRTEYSISADGTDAVVKFGPYKGCRISYSILEKAFRDWLKTILAEGCPSDLKDVILYQIQEWEQQQ